MKDLKTELLRTKLFDGLEISDAVLSGLPLREISLGTQRELFVQGETGREVFFLVRGRLLAVHWTRSGREILFSRIEEGDAVGELAAIDGGSRSLTVYAQQDCFVIAMPTEGYLHLLATHPDVSLRVMRNLSALVRGLTQRAYQNSTMTVEERVRRCIVRLAVEASAFHTQGEIKDAPTHSEIASLIGANREAVSRAISALKKNGTIEGGRGHIRVIDPDILLEDLVN
mmetsp:Transcript_6999/g.11318  ORF Transcript_6999/g.11318 Transcript_6999/m.11318 type:complete len:228 (+) Transcript_6999:3313-3996(+)